MSQYPFVPLTPLNVATTAPYTYSDAATFLEILQDYRNKLNEVIAQENTNSEAYSDWYKNANDQLDAAVKSITDMTAGYNDQLTKMQQLDDKTNKTLTDELAKVQAALDAASAANAQTVTLANEYTDAINRASGMTDALSAKVDGVSNKLPGKVDVNTLVYNVKDFGALGDGQTNDTAAVKAAMAACDTDAGSGGTVYFPAGTYMVDAITVPRGVTLMGSGIGNLGSYSSTIKYTGTTDIFVTMGGENSNIVNLCLMGPGSASSTTGIRAYQLSTMRLESMTIASFGTGIYIEQVWYAAWNDVKITQCNNGANVVYCYNVQAYNFRISGIQSDGTSRAATGVSLVNRTCMNIHGGSIEAVQTGFIQTANTHLYTSGMYFEGYGKCFTNTGYNSSLVILGSTVYIGNAGEAWVDWSGACGERIVSIGNHFKGGDSSASPQALAYKFPTNPQNGFTARVTIFGDSWLNTTGGQYRNDTAVKGLVLSDPYGETISQTGGVGDDGVFGTLDWSGTILADGLVKPYASDTRFNVSGGRASAYVGAMGFDTKLNKPVWWQGSHWVDASGATV